MMGEVVICGDIAEPCDVVLPRGGGRYDGIREELAAGVNAPLHEKKKPRASHWPSGAELTGCGEKDYSVSPRAFTSQSPMSKLGP
jgi:hypothetical protein